jgi:hypothetical protein
MSRALPAQVSNSRQWAHGVSLLHGSAGCREDFEAVTQKPAAAILACGRANGTRGLTPLFLQ